MKTDKSNLLGQQETKKEELDVKKNPFEVKIEDVKLENIKEIKAADAADHKK